MFRDWARSVYLRYWYLPRIDRNYKHSSLTDAFRNVYSSKIWGDNGQPFYSGAGSHGPVSEHYCASVIAFIRENNIQSVVDMGCGDFSVGGRIVAATGIRYTGMDVVPELIEYHQKHVSDPRVSFVCADITRDPLPPADLYLVRQVLQHLSNKEIAGVLANLGSGSRALISEDIQEDMEWFNVDKAHGPNVRFAGSGVYVDRAPFSVPAVELWNVPLDKDTRLRTVLVGPR